MTRDRDFDEGDQADGEAAGQGRIPRHSHVGGGGRDVDRQESRGPRRGGRPADRTTAGAIAARAATIAAAAAGSGGETTAILT